MKKTYYVLNNKVKSPILQSNKRPVKGAQVMANIHPDFAPGTLLGIVQYVEDKTCTYLKPDGSKNTILWNDSVRYGFSTYVIKPNVGNYLRSKKRRTLDFLK